MKPPRILVPIDLGHFSPEVFRVVNDFARNSCALVALLHVVNLNILALESRVYEELGREALWHLNRISEFVAPTASVQIRVRYGKISQEILAEANAEKTDLILLSARQRSTWNGRLTFPWSSGTPFFGSLAERLTSGAGCRVLVVPVKTTCDCESAWGRPLLAQRSAVSPGMGPRSFAPEGDKAETVSVPKGTTEAAGVDYPFTHF